MPNQPLRPIVRYASLKLKVLTSIIALSAVYYGVGSDYAYAGPPEPPEYEVTVIPGPDCGMFGYGPANGWGINDLGNICGDERNCASEWEPFFWSPETGRIVLNAPPSILQGRALDLNNANAVVGWYDNGQPDQGRFGFVWQDGLFTTLPSMPGSVLSEAHAINDKGDIAGEWIDHADTGLLRALMWREGEVFDISKDLMWLKSRANDINQSGQITGWTATSIFTDARAFVWQDGKVIDLGVIPGGYTGMGMAINNHGDVAVEGRMLNDKKEIIKRSFLWRDGQWIDIGVLPGCEETRVYDINDARQIIGRCEGSTVIEFMWQDGIMIELDEHVIPNDPDFTGISGVRAISNTGSIAGGGNHNEFGGIALRLSPIVTTPGDLDGDGDVDVADLLALLGSWGICDDCNDCPADLDDNCSVGTSDLLILFSNWG